MSNTRDLEHWVKMQLAPSSKTKDIVKASQKQLMNHRVRMMLMVMLLDGLLMLTQIIYIIQEHLITIPLLYCSIRRNLMVSSY